MARALRWSAAALAILSFGTLLTRPRVARIVISKSSRTLTAYLADGCVLKEFPIVLGSDERGPKVREGDRRTPEGEYYVCFKNPKSRFRRSLALSYPNLEDARRGRAQGLIGEAEYHEIAEALRRKRVPPWKTPLGGEIFIHGGMEKHDATAGCVAIATAAIEELFPLVAMGTPVVIEP